MTVGDFVIVEGKSLRGWNRIREHGKVWKIRKIWGSKTLLESTDGKDCWRWVDGKFDIDFEIIDTVNL